MPKITMADKQAKITIPQEIMQLKNWSGGIEIIFVPFIQEPKMGLDEDTTILLKEVKKPIKTGK